MPRGGIRFLFADYMLKRRELRRGSEPIEAKPLLRLVQQLDEPNASLGISNLSEVLSFCPPGRSRQVRRKPAKIWAF